MLNVVVAAAVVGVLSECQISKIITAITTCHTSGQLWYYMSIPYYNNHPHLLNWKKMFSLIKLIFSHKLFLLLLPLLSLLLSNVFGVNEFKAFNVIKEKLRRSHFTDTPTPDANQYTDRRTSRTSNTNTNNDIDMMALANTLLWAEKHYLFIRPNTS